MDCKNARLLLPFYRPTSTDLDEADTAALENHLALCPECQALDRSEHLFDHSLGQAMRDVAVPAGLQRRLLDRLGRPRRPFYYRHFSRIASGLAAAGVLLLAGLLIWIWLKPPRPELQLADLFDQEVGRMMGSPNPESVSFWFSVNHKVTMVPPPRFNYANLVHYGLEDWQGKRVPLLVFVRGNTQAKVFVVTAEQFNINPLPTGSGILDTGGFQVDIWKDLEPPGTAFIIIYTGPDGLAPLLRNDPQL
jgi:hypothetical protein